MSDQRLTGFSSVEWGEGAQAPPPRPTPHSPLKSGGIDSRSIR